MFELMTAPRSGPPKRVATFEDPRVAAIAGYRRCRMYSAGSLADTDAQWASVDHVENGERTTLLEFRRVSDKEGATLGVSVDTSSLSELAAEFFHLEKTADGQLLIQGPR